MKQYFSGYILAGGKSSRMGRDKALLETGGETFLARAVKTLRGVCENRVRVVVNENQAENYNAQFPALDLIVDEFAERGAPGGIHAALRRCDTKFAIILAVDLPFVNAGAIEKLAEIAASSNKFSAVVPRQNDARPQPLCAVYHAKYCLPPLADLLDADKSASVGEFLELIFPKYVEENQFGADDRLFFNVNRPADFETLK